MACTSVVFSGINGQCDINKGGIRRIYIANKTDIISVDVNQENGNVVDIAMEKDKLFKAWNFRTGTASFSTSATSDITIGTIGGTATLSLQFTRADSVKRAEIERAIKAEAVVIVQTNYTEEDPVEGPFMHYFMMGLDTYVSVDSPVMQTGTAVGDLNGFTLNLVENYYELPHFIDTGQVKMSLIVDETDLLGA